jgi:hypothetical protein
MHSDSGRHREEGECWGVFSMEAGACGTSFRSTAGTNRREMGKFFALGRYSAGENFFKGLANSAILLQFPASGALNLTTFHSIPKFNLDGMVEFLKN